MIQLSSLVLLWTPHLLLIICSIFFCSYRSTKMGWNWILQIWTYRMLTGIVLHFFLLAFICDHYSWKVAWNGIWHFIHQACGNQMKHVSKIIVLVCFVMIYCWCKVWTYDLCGHYFAQNDCKLEILNRMHLRFSRFSHFWISLLIFSGRQMRQWSRNILLDKVPSYLSRLGQVTCLFQKFLVLFSYHKGKWIRSYVTVRVSEMSVSVGWAYCTHLQRCFWTVPGPVFLPQLWPVGNCVRTFMDDLLLQQRTLSVTW
jgi:hypothetical protein